MAVNTAGLAAGTYTATVRVESAGVNGSPKLVPVTLSLAPAAAAALSVTPSSLAFTATAGGANPAAQTLSVANTGTGTLSFTASDNAAWLAVTPASGTAPASLSVSVNVAGLAAGTYSGAVTVTARRRDRLARHDPGDADREPNTPPPSTGLVGAWGFDEAQRHAPRRRVGPRQHRDAVRPAAHDRPLRRRTVVRRRQRLVSVPDAASLDLTTGITIASWVRPDALGTSGARSS